MENESEIVNSQNDTETTENNDELNLDLSDDNESSDDDVETLRKENATLKAQKDHWKKKATEVKDEKPKEPESTSKKEDLEITPKDTLALIEAKISAEDYDEVVRVAKILGKPVMDALKDNTLKSILRERVEERLTANAAQVKSPRSSSKPAGEVLLDRASKGELPEKDEDITNLAEARMAERLQNRS